MNPEIVFDWISATSRDDVTSRDEYFLSLYYIFIIEMAQQAKQAAQRLGGLFPQGAGKGAGAATGALVILGALGYGVNASLFNGKL